MRDDRGSDQAAGTAGVLILVVEDERSIAEPFMSALRRSGFGTELARTGADAIALAKSGRFDVVLLDLGLPDMDGRDVCRRLPFRVCRSSSSAPATR